MDAAAGMHDLCGITPWMLGLAVAASMATASPQATAGERNLSVNDFQVTTYTEKDGAPVNTWVMAQTADGWLWFGGPNGLHRFDGIRFEEVKIDSGDSTRSAAVSVLYAPPSGELMIGKLRGGISILKNGTLTDYDSDQTGRAGRVNDITQDADGTLWATTNDGVLRFDGGMWQRIGGEWGLPGGRMFSVRLDQHGTLWVCTETAVLYLARGKRKFESTDIAQRGGGYGFVQSQDGRLWVYDLKHLELLPGQTLAGPLDPTVNSRSSQEAFFDRQGYFWVWGKKAGDLWPEPAVTGVTSLERLPTSALEDREGNIWLGSGHAAIYRFRRPSVETVRAMATGKAAFVVEPTGTVWIGIGGTPIDRGNEGVWNFDTALHHLLPDEIKRVDAIARGSDGAIWLATAEGLWRRRGARFELAVVLPDAARGQQVNGFSPDCAGGLWLSVPTLGLVRYNGSTWRPNGDVAGLPAEMPTAQTCDSSGQVWLGYANGKVARVALSGASWFGATEGLRVGAVTSIGIGPTRTIIAGERGLAMLHGSRFVTLKAADSRIFEKITGIVEAPDGDVWTNSAVGLARIDAKEIGAWTKGASTIPIAAQLFDAGDGYPGLGIPITTSGPSAVLGSDGRVWFAGREGIARIDPSRVQRAPGKPPVFIQALSSGGALVEHANGATLAKDTHNIEVDYTALSYSHPERLRFRYQLEGIDARWVEVGTRRQASYANLGPGAYRFIVNVTNENGAWTDSSSSVDFVIPPTFIQTRTFLAICMAAALVVLALLYQARVRQLTARERQLVESRLKERERIARELHDTLLQGTQALILKVHGAAKLAPIGEPVREALDEALACADDVVAEGRDRIQDLRLADEAGDDLTASLTSAGEALSRGGSVSFHIAVEGPALAMASDALQTAYRIGREAMLNAFRHAQPNSVEVQLIFSNNDFRLRVRDDGVGIHEAVFEGGSRAGHWGLPGMRERAQGIGAELEVWSRPGAGTEIELRIPAPAAYARRAAHLRWWGFARVIGKRPT